MKILLAEDDVRLARAVRRAFEEEKHKVEITGDGRSALRLAQNGDFDVMLLDVMLPEMDGLEVCKRMRVGGVQTPVLMLTARAEVQDRVKGLDAGADDYLVKPFAVAELLARARALFRTRARTSNGREQMRAGDLTLDVSRHSAVRGNREIELTVKEFQLLELLLRHKGQVLSRSQILDHVWQDDRDFASNIVDIYIHYLRNKVDKGFNVELIHTIRGVGYMLDP